MREYEFRLTKQSIYNSDLMLLPLGRVRANNFDQAKSKALNEARRQEILLSASVIVKIEIKNEKGEWMEI